MAYCAYLCTYRMTGLRRSHFILSFAHRLRNVCQYLGMACQFVWTSVMTTVSGEDLPRLMLKSSGFAVARMLSTARLLFSPGGDSHEREPWRPRLKCSGITHKTRVCHLLSKNELRRVYICFPACENFFILNSSATDLKTTGGWLKWPHTGKSAVLQSFLAKRKQSYWPRPREELVNIAVWTRHRRDKDRLSKWRHTTWGGSWQSCAEPDRTRTKRDFKRAGWTRKSKAMLARWPGF